MSIFSHKRLKFGSKARTESKQDSIILRFYDPVIKAPDFKGRRLDDILDWNDSHLERSHNYVQMLFPLPEGSPYNYEAPVIDRPVLEAFRSRPELRNALRRSFERILQFYGFVVSAEVEKAGEDGQNSAVTETDENEKDEQQSLHDPAPGTKRKAEDEGKIDNEGREAEATPGRTEQAGDEAKADEDKDAGTATKTSDQVENGANESACSAVSSPPNSPSGCQVIRAPHWKEAFANWAVQFDHNHLRITRILRCLRVLSLTQECQAFYLALQQVFNDPKIRISQRSMDFWTKAVEEPLWKAPDGTVCAWIKQLDKGSLQ
ncbi:hypothetical protein BS50DRAFT_670632 [Corynespora cassiicola Philippines]|uniref:Opioid growth factor receptor (OGFr) conserved domain-containing protein n=1 Tax=Corynespora cassiicola Philippines TaxID=1448308 RepID=A0A2T2P950_CORCC|nr:hypothetical protein BS50DRAFT_670632 [Corynespora cassiicola Philippines]